ncbi:transcriptional regulator with XRE-family HTH domain [Oceanisphaera litoralis]|uniref:helix-turn-helix domain-containing protein n=1 Tax=Oceanisphaera litoralis TaxID=225144 RepID=UPI00195CFA47|nr:helix-turn-helix transcriptional regulator [Oceanisphaera litoralis]MBM7456866.1 transcriptional regulator with XRE-family HTH domain [Oceanisphaera litoralis]
MKESEISEKLSLYLVQLRKLAGLSQEDVAVRSDAFGMRGVLDQRTISRIEKQPLKASAINIAAYLTAVGSEPSEYFIFLDGLTNKLGRASMDVVNKKTRHAISSMIEKSVVNVIGAKEALLSHTHSYLNDFLLEDKLDNGIYALKNLDRKPVIGFFGHFDAGKSTLINTIIDEKLLPAKYQPATCVVNLLMHEDDRPNLINGQVALFSKGFMPHMIHDESMVKTYLIEQGDTSVLDRLGIHNYDEDLSSDAYVAVVFSTAEILERAWLLDTPGNLNDEDSGDSEKALGGVELADGIVFLSKTTGFMSDVELYFGAQIIRQRPPLDKLKPLEHILFVQSHCHSEIPYDEVLKVGDIAFKRCKKQFDDLVFESWKNDGKLITCPGQNELSNRTLPFWRENEKYRNELVDEVDRMVDYLTSNHVEIVKDNIERINKSLNVMLGQVIHELENKKDSVENRVNDILAQEQEFRKESDILKKEFSELISSCRAREVHDLATLRNFYDSKTSVESLTKLIESSFDNQKTAQNEIGNYIGQLLTTEIENTLKGSGKAFSFDLDSLLVRWQKSTPNICKESDCISSVGNLELDISGFDSRAAFIGGLSGISSLGAMSLYVSTIASNLGAYILVGKAAGVLTSLGLASSVTSVTSFVAAIGGPITIGIAIAAAIGYMFYRLAGGSWQKGLAKKVCEAFEKDSVWEKVENPVKDFWVSTEHATKSGLSELISETECFIESLKEDASKEYNVNELSNCIKTLSKVKSFF